MGWGALSEEDYAPSRTPGYWRQHVHKGTRTQHGKPQGVVSGDQPEAREGQAGRPGVAERFVVPLKPGNSGGGEGTSVSRQTPNT